MKSCRVEIGSGISAMSVTADVASTRWWHSIRQVCLSQWCTYHSGVPVTEVCLPRGVPVRQVCLSDRCACHNDVPVTVTEVCLLQRCAWRTGVCACHRCVSSQRSACHNDVPVTVIEVCLSQRCAYRTGVPAAAVTWCCCRLSSSFSLLLSLKYDKFITFTSWPRGIKFLLQKNIAFVLVSH